MPTRTPRDTRLPTALLLLGMVGLVASGLGLFPAVPAWAWLAVLVLGVAMPLAGKRVAVRRFDAAELRRLAKARRNLRVARRGMQRDMGRLSKRLDERLANTITPEVAEQLVAQHNAMATDVDAMKRQLVVLMQERNSKKFGGTFGGSQEEGG